MLSPSPASNRSDSALFALFGDDSEAVTRWKQSVQKRLDAISSANIPNPILLPPKLGRAEHEAELRQLCDTVKQVGFALYDWNCSQKATTNFDKVSECVNNLHQRLSLYSADDGVIRDAHGLSLLEDKSGTPQGRFPPYQPTPLKWHTDGYYNATQDAVRCFTLHCVEPAAEGGALLVMDDTLLVWALLQDNPYWVELLAHPQAMTLPANSDMEGHDRPDRSVAMINRQNDGAVSMRFTTRARNIHWRCGETQAAANRAAELIALNPNWHSRILLQRGQGIITRNILHARDAFTDESGKPKRQMLRGRFNQIPVYNTALTTQDNHHALR